MKYLNIIHEEGAFNLKSVRGLIEANITVLHPELVLEDNSMIIFDSVDSYYDFIGNADMVSMYDHNIHVDNLLSYEKTSDIVSNFSYKGEDVTVVIEITYHDRKIYYLQRTGINPIAE